MPPKSVFPRELETCLNHPWPCSFFTCFSSHPQILDILFLEMIHLTKRSSNIYRHIQCINKTNQSWARNLSTPTKPTSLTRSYLYVPTSSDRMLEKSTSTGSDVIIYDLEDSVSPAPEDKLTARTRLKKFLEVLSIISLSCEKQ